MSENKELIYIFHIFRKEGESLILHPFAAPDKLVQLLENNRIEGRYGIEPRVEALTLLKNDLYRTIEGAVKSWVSDVRFIPKFLISAGIFLVSYLFLSFVVRDPLPVVDEVAISAALSLAAYFLLGRRDIKSDMAARKRLSLRSAVDKIAFTESVFVKKIERNLHANEAENLDSLVERMVAPYEKTEIEVSEKEEAKSFIRACEIMFKLQNIKREEKMLKRFLDSPAKKSNIQEIKKWIESRKIDIPLYAVYKNCKERVAGTK